MIFLFSACILTQPQKEQKQSEQQNRIVVPEENQSHSNQDAHQQNSGKRQGDSNSTADPSDQSMEFNGITQTAPDKYIVNADFWHETFQQPETIVTSIRAIPYSNDDNITEGFRLMGIRKTSLFSHLGLKNGDIIHFVNGSPLRNAEEAMVVWQTLQSAKVIYIEITRNKTKRVIEYKIQPQDNPPK